MAAVFDRDPDFRRMILGRDQHLAAQMPTPTGQILILDMQPGDADSLVLLNHAHNVEQGAEAGLGVGDHRDAHRPAHPFQLHDHLGQGPHPKVGIAERAGRHTTGIIHQGKTGLFDQPRRDHIIGTGGHEEPVLG